MAARSGQTAVTTAGTEVALGSVQIDGPLMVKALAANTGLVFIGNTGGAVTSATGMQLAAGEVVIFNWVGHLGSILVDSAVNGEGVAWLALEM
jgi:hypothetical protein